MLKHRAAVVLLLASCVGTQLAVAQSKPGQPGQGGRTSFGIVGGVNLATMSEGNLPAGETATPYKNRTGFHAGLAANIPLGTSLFLQPQALYSMKGAKASFSWPGTGVYSSEADVNYLEVPLFVGLRIPMQGGGLRPYVMAGPSIGIKLGCKERMSGPGLSEESDCKDPDTGESFIKSTDIGLAFGAGIEVPMGSGLLSLGARYTLGLSDVNKNPGSGDPTIRNRVISIGVGYFFGR